MGGVLEQHFSAMFDPWKDFGTVIKGELKRTIASLNVATTLLLGPTLASADYGKLMKKHKARIGKIDNEVKGALDKVPIPGGFKAAAFICNPGLGFAIATRSAAGKVTPEAVEQFSKDYGFDDLMIGRFPVGRFGTWAAKKAAKAGGFVTLNQMAFDSEKDTEEKAKTKWYTPLERIFLLQSPLGSYFKESNLAKGSLLLEAEVKDEEEKAFMDFINSHESMQQYYTAVGVPYIKAHDELITGLVDVFEKEIQEISEVATAETFKDFISAIEKAESEKLDAFNVSNLKKGMEQTVEDLAGNEEELDKFLKVAKKPKAEFGNEKELKEFLIQKVYEKEFSKIRFDAVSSIENGVEEIKNEILNDFENEDIKDLKGTPIGNQLADIIETALERLDKATQSIGKIKGSMN